MKITQLFGRFLVSAMFLVGLTAVARVADVDSSMDVAPAVVVLTNLVYTYDGTEKSATAATTPEGLVVDLTYDGSSDIPVNVGSYTVIATINDANYVGAATDTLVVAAATLTVTADNAFRRAGVDNPTFTVSYSGFVSGEDAGILSGDPNVYTTADAGSPAGSYTITVDQGSLSAPNYELNFVDGTLTVAWVWDNTRVSFVKSNNVDWTQSTNQDHITSDVWLTRKNSQGLFNIAQEAAYANGVSPANTEWAYGTTADLPLSFLSWTNWNGNNPTSSIGREAVLHIISEGLYIDFKLTSWTPGAGGGGFSYERAIGPRVWSSNTTTFTKENYANWMLATNQDRITWNVAITRQDDKGLFNIIAESSYGSDTPSDTEWAYGTTEDLPNLSFSTWHYWHGGNPPNTVGEPAVLHLITDDIYIDIMFTSWTSGEDEGGGGFTYDRAQSPIVVTLNSNRVVFVLQGTAFDDPGATAVAAGGSPLSVSVAGTVDTSELGEYTLTYAAFDGLGNVGFVQRIVKVVTSVPVPEFWTRLVVPFAKQNYADWELPENQDRLTANVWLTRQDDRGLFNYSLESEYNSSTPSDTEWAYGDIADFSELTYMTWHEWSRLNGDTPSILGGDAVLHLISEDIYIPVKFTSWTSGEGVGGGGFSYERGGVVFVTMAGASSMPVLLGDTFTDPGASAVDVDGNPLTVVTNGVVDTGTPGIYVISYSATDARGRCGIAKRYVDVVTSMPKIWSGARKTFTKADYADWTLPENQDLVTTTVAITRQDDHGLFNIINESEYASATPSDTEWAYGTTADLFSLSFTSWHDWARSLGDTTSIIGRDAVMHIISEDIYIDVKFTAWTSNANGGGFSYERAQAPVTLTMHGPAEKFIIQGDSFVDPGADAVDSDLNVLPVTVDGAVDVNVLGDYVLTYTASNLGYTSTVTRLVHVVLTIPPPKLAIMPSYTRQVTYGNAALNEPITVWGRAWAVLATPCNYEINFGDGSVETGAVANASFIGAEHTYVSGGSKTVTLTLTDGNGSVISRQAVIKVFPTPTHEQRINMAIEKGLLWIYRNQKTKDATRVYWEAEDERGVGATAASLLSFLENGHAAANDYEQDIYAQTVQKGLNWQLNNSNVGYFDIYAHSDGLQMRDPDSNGNGKGIYLQSDTYASAYAAIAVILSQPNAQAASNTFVTSGPFVGRSYYDVIQDLYDQFSFSQGDGAHRGGWQYSQLTTDAGSFDGSAQQWPCLVFLAGTERLGLAPQQWVIDNAIWAFDQLQDASSGGVGYGNSGNWQNIAKTGGFLTACKLAGRSVTNDLSVQKALGFIGDNWYAQGGATPGGWAGEFYAMYGSKKGMMFQEVENVVTPTGVRNWYNDMSAWLLGTSEGSPLALAGLPFIPADLQPGLQNLNDAFGQNVDGSWETSQGTISGKPLGTSAAILILTKSVTKPLPVAVIAAVGAQPDNSTPFALDGSGSYHQDSGNTITEYLWDFDSSDGLDWNSPDATGARPTHPGFSMVGTYTITLMVKDASDPANTSVASIQVVVTADDVPPVAIAIPPGRAAYAGRVGSVITLDGSASYDPNGDTITNYVWDLNGNGVYGDGDDVVSSDPTTTVTFTNEYVGAIGLQVTANGLSGVSVSQVEIFASSNDVRVVSAIATNVMPGVSADMEVVLLNDAAGAADLSNVVVRFYNGNPLLSGSQFSSNYMVDLPRGIEVPLNVALVNMAGVDPVNIYVYVDANFAIPEWDESNNVMVAEAFIIPQGDEITSVTPDHGSVTGGYTVTIVGQNLGAGADVTNVTLCGVNVASIDSQSATEIVVTAAAGTPGLGDVTVESVSAGSATKANAFTYNPTITVVAGPNGTVMPGGVVELAYGGSTNFVVTADTYYHISSLMTNGVADEAVINQIVYTSVWENVTATGVLAVAFVENVTSNTSTPEWWLAQYGLTNGFEEEAVRDADDDGADDWEEYIAGTDPTNSASIFIISLYDAAFGINSPDASIWHLLRWPSVSGRVYGVTYATNLMDGGWQYTDGGSNLFATPPENVYTNTVSTNNAAMFYRIQVSLP